VPLELIIEILNESCLAPSSSNRQPWRFIIITNKDLMKKLSDECKHNLLLEMAENPGFLESRYRDLLSDPQYNVVIFFQILNFQQLFSHSYILSQLCQSATRAMNKNSL
jgi:nitroreductase